MRAAIVAGGLACAVLAALCVLPVAARAALVGEFDARLTDVKRSYGAYTVVADARVYETSGQPPPPLTEATIYFPRGAALRSSFLRKRFYCDVDRLLRYPPDPARCRDSQFASGRIVLDARPHIPDAFSADVHLFLAEGHEAGGGSEAAEGGEAPRASVVVLVLPNETTPAYTYQVLEGGLFNRSGIEGRFGYRLELPTRVKPLIPGLILHLAELHLSVRGLRLERRSRRPLFWTKVPSCPRSRKVSFGADYAFEGSKVISRRRRVDCRRFVRRPSVHREGQVPGAPG